MKQKIIPGETTEAKWLGPKKKKGESTLSTVQGNSVICLVRVNNFPPFTLEVKYGLVSSLYREDTSLIHLTLHSPCSFRQHFSIFPYLICLLHSVLTWDFLSSLLGQKPVLLQFPFHWFICIPFRINENVAV